MGRIRTIKPEVLTDAKAARLSNEAWRLWVSSWVIADDLGRLPADPAMLGGAIFWGFPNPLDEASRALASLRESSMVEIYEVNGEPYMQIRGWRKHQKIDRPSGPKFPPPPQEVSQQTLPGLASPREDSRALDADHDLDLDHDHDPDQRSASDPGVEASPGPTEQGGTTQNAHHGAKRDGAAPEPPPGEKKRAAVKPARDVPDQAVTLAFLLLGMITTNHPTSRIAKAAELRRNEAAMRWAVTIDKMNRLDGHEWGAIEGMITWSQRHSFWRTVILGADNLRDKWDTMTGQRSRPDRAPPPGRPPAKRGPTALALEDVERLEAQEREQGATT